MWIDNDMEHYLREMESLRSCKIIITDFENVIFNNITDNELNNIISRGLLKILLDFSVKAPSRQIIYNEEDTIQVPIFERKEYNKIKDCCQIIMPIYRFNTLSGLLITYFYKSNRDYELKNSITITQLIRKYIEEKVQGFHINDLLKMENISKMFNEEYLTQVAELYEMKKHRLQKNKQYKRKKEKVSQFISNFEKTLSPEQQKNFDDILSITYKLSDFDQALMYSVGIKYGAELSKM